MMATPSTILAKCKRVLHLVLGYYSKYQGACFAVRPMNSAAELIAAADAVNRAA